MKDTYHLFKALLKAFTDKDTNAVLAVFADDATLFDPHYPKPKMTGKPEISKGLGWAFANIKQFKFEEISYLEDNKNNTAVGVYRCSHLLPNGARLNFNQVFVMITENGLITGLDAYLPYGPGGLSGAMLKLSHVLYSVKG